MGRRGVERQLDCVALLNCDARAQHGDNLGSAEVGDQVGFNKPYRISDGDGLSVQIQPNGHELRRYRYRFADVEKLLALGSFPATSLADARAKRDAARAALEKGIEPSVQKKLDKIAAATQARNTFGATAEEYIENLGVRGAAETTQIHALTDADCRPIAFMLTGGRVADGVAGAALLERLPECDILHGDKGYDANAVRRQGEEHGATPNIPPKANCKWKNRFSPFLYRNRNAIEPMVCA